MARFSRRVTMFFAAVLAITVFIDRAKSASIAVRVSATSDDAEENVLSGIIESLDSSDLELGFESIPDDGEGPQFVGMRFQGVAIPPGSTIDSAFIQFTVDEDDKGSVPANYLIFGHRAADATTFTTRNGNIVGRTGTSSVSWLDVPSWSGQVGQAGPDQMTPDLSAIIQEIIDLPRWVSGNAIAIGIGLQPPIVEANRTAVSFDGDPNAAPLLEISFTPIPEPSSFILTVSAVVLLVMFRRR